MSASPASEPPASSMEAEDLPVGILADEGEERAAHRSPHWAQRVWFSPRFSAGPRPRKHDGPVCFLRRLDLQSPYRDGERQLG